MIEELLAKYHKGEIFFREALSIALEQSKTVLPLIDNDNLKLIAMSALDIVEGWKNDTFTVEDVYRIDRKMMDAYSFPLQLQSSYSVHQSAWCSIRKCVKAVCTFNYDGPNPFGREFAAILSCCHAIGFAEDAQEASHSVDDNAN